MDRGRAWSLAHRAMSQSMHHAAGHEHSFELMTAQPSIWTTDSG